jgi:TrmH family RNA methyltransferase
MPYPALSRADAKRMRALRQRTQRAETGLFLAEGIRVVEELARSGVVLRHAIVSPSIEDSARGRALVAELAARVPVFSVTEGELREISDTDAPQGVIAAALIPVATLPETAPERTLVLDGIQDPGNFGTLLRSAVAFGTGLVVTLPGTVDPWNAKAVRAAAGANFHVPIVSVESDQLSEWCRTRGISLWGAAMDGDPINGTAMPEYVALVMGNEGAGIRAGTRAILDRTVALRMRGPAESLNVGVAGGILLYLLSEHQS